MKRAPYPAVAGAAILAAASACVSGPSVALAQMPRNQSVLQAPALPAPIPLMPPRAAQPPGQYPAPAQPYPPPAQGYAPAQPPYAPAPAYAPAQPYRPAQPYPTAPAAPGQQDLLQPEPAPSSPTPSSPTPSAPSPEQATPSTSPSNTPAAPSAPADQTAPPVQSGWVPKQVAELWALDKVDAAVTPITIKVGQSVQYKSLTVTLRACNARPADQPADFTAFLDITDSRPGAPGFHGWTFAHDPSLSALQDPVYSVHLASCTDEQAPPTQAASSAKPAATQGTQP